MKVSYKGIKGEVPPKLLAKLDTKFAKLSKLLEARGEKEAHVVVTSERYLHHAEITLQFYDHQLVSVGLDSDVFTAMSVALDKMEQLAVKQREKWREKKRRPELAKSAAPAPSADGGKRVFRVDHRDRRKPMTLDEALIEMEGGRDYV